MLDILSISKGAYRLLKQGGDSHAVRNASIIHRLMSQAGASERMIEFASDCKVKWDIWFREKRHTMAEFDINFLQEAIAVIASDWAKSKKTINSLETEIDNLMTEVSAKKISGTLNNELLLGAIFSAVVRNEAR